MELIAFQSPMAIGRYSHASLFAKKPQSPFQYICERDRRIRIAQRPIYLVPIHCAFDGQSESSTATEIESSELLSDATTVSVQLPLDVYLEETTDGRIFVDELVADGNAERSGLLREGDVITAVSLPFGDGLFPVPDSSGLEMIASYIESREDDNFRLAVVRTNSVQDLRIQSANSSENTVPISEHLDLMREIHIPEYPIMRPGDDGPSSSSADLVPDLEALREQGFDIPDSSQRER